MKYFIINYDRLDYPDEGQQTMVFKVPTITAVYYCCSGSNMRISSLSEICKGEYEGAIMAGVQNKEYKFSI
jgi:hypothetical protein